MIILLPIALDVGNTLGRRFDMGSVGIKINGEWVDLMSAFVPCQLCNEPVQIRDLEDISSDSVNGVVTWQCAKCKAVNG